MGSWRRILGHIGMVSEQYICLRRCVLYRLVQGQRQEGLLEHCGIDRDWKVDVGMVVSGQRLVRRPCRAGSQDRLTVQDSHERLSNVQYGMIRERERAEGKRLDCFDCSFQVANSPGRIAT